MRTDHFTEKLFNDGFEGVGCREGKTRESKGGGCAAATERRGVVGFGKGNLLVFDEEAPESVGFEGLGFSNGGEVGVNPVGGCVAVLERPVALCIKKMS